jgi:hypothetical protein
MSLTFDCRADRVRLGDTLAPVTYTRNGFTFTWDAEYVTSLQLIGDDVVINERTTTSRSNRVAVLLRANQEEQ